MTRGHGDEHEHRMAQDYRGKHEHRIAQSHGGGHEYRMAQSHRGGHGHRMAQDHGVGHGHRMAQVPQSPQRIGWAGWPGVDNRAFPPALLTPSRENAGQALGKGPEPLGQCDPLRSV